MSSQPKLTQREKYYLLPGEVIVVDYPCEITTVLGSCVAIILYDKNSCLSGMIHYLLPQASEDSPESIGKYGNLALPKLIDLLRSRGLISIQAKMFGGGRVLENVQIGNGVGEENISLGLKMLESYNIPINEKNIGGQTGRKICFSTDTHQITCEYVKGAK